MDSTCNLNRGASDSTESDIPNNIPKKKADIFEPWKNEAINTKFFVADNIINQLSVHLDLSYDQNTNPI